MEAKDTVMSYKQKIEILGTKANEWWDSLPDTMDADLLAQAEISFKAGQDSMLKEVKEWINNHQQGLCAGQDIQEVAGNDCKYGNTSHLLLPWLDWQAFKKSKGIK